MRALLSRVAILLAFVLVTAAFSGCSTANDADTDSLDKSSQTQTENTESYEIEMVSQAVCGSTEDFLVELSRALYSTDGLILELVLHNYNNAYVSLGGRDVVVNGKITLAAEPGHADAKKGESIPFAIKVDSFELERAGVTEIYKIELPYLPYNGEDEEGFEFTGESSGTLIPKEPSKKPYDVNDDGICLYSENGVELVLCEKISVGNKRILRFLVKNETDMFIFLYGENNGAFDEVVDSNYTYPKTARFFDVEIADADVDSVTWVFNVMMYEMLGVEAVDENVEIKLNI